MRRLKPDPVPDELIWKLLDAAVKAPSGGNRQPWNFLVIRDPEIKRKIGEYYLDGWNRGYGPLRDFGPAHPPRTRGTGPENKTTPGLPGGRLSRAPRSRGLPEGTFGAAGPPAGRA